MKKIEFIASLSSRLSALTYEEIDEHVSFYCEMIDDRIDAGLSEEEAVADIGNVEEIARAILSEEKSTHTTFYKKANDTLKKCTERLTAGHTVGEIVLIALGAPIWLSLLIAALAIAISLYAAIWSVVVSFWAAFLSLAIGGLGSAILGIIMVFAGIFPQGFGAIGAGLLAMGLSIFTFFGCKFLTKCTLLFTKKIYLAIKDSIDKRRN